MRAVGRIAVTVGSVGVVLPFLGGIGLGLALSESTETSVFLGAALAATSAGITSATFLDLGIARRPAARTVLGAAVVDDILALILLGRGRDGGRRRRGRRRVALALVVAVAFVAFVALGGTRLLQTRRSCSMPLALPTPAAAGGDPASVSPPSPPIGLAALIGAFLAGMIVAETRPELDRAGSPTSLRLLPSLLLRLHRHRAQPRLAVQRPRAAAAGGDHGIGGGHRAMPPTWRHAGWGAAKRE